MSSGQSRVYWVTQLRTDGVLYGDDTGVVSQSPEQLGNVEWGPLPKGFPTGVMENLWALDGTHTGAMVLYYGFAEQA